jgi:hypothetical protein
VVTPCRLQVVVVVGAQSAARHEAALQAACSTGSTDTADARAERLGDQPGQKAKY